MGPDFASLELSDTHFEEVRQLVYRTSGINLMPGKAGLVRSRLLKRLRALQLPDYDTYLTVLREDATGQELSAMVDVLTTNKTFFFREPQHFDFMRETVLPGLANRERLRFWSAGCSSGEEPYTLAMVLRESLPDIDTHDVRILATDICSDMVRTAREAIYPASRLEGVPADYLKRYFEPVRGVVSGSAAYRARPLIRNLVSVARLNLMADWPMQGPFDAIFCRNVMIYFDRPTQQRLVERFAGLLAPGGYLFVGHSESLCALSNCVRYVRPAVYVR